MVFADRDEAGRRLAGRPGTCGASPWSSWPAAGRRPGGVRGGARAPARRWMPPWRAIAGVPFQPELGMGATGKDGVRVINRDHRPSQRRRTDRDRGDLERSMARGGASRARTVPRRPPRAAGGRRGTVVVVDVRVATPGTAGTIGAGSRRAGTRCSADGCCRRRRRSATGSPSWPVRPTRSSPLERRPCRAPRRARTTVHPTDDAERGGPAGPPSRGRDEPEVTVAVQVPRRWATSSPA